MARAKIEKSMIGVHLDVGHDSIGWCVTSTNPDVEEYLAIPGCGVVLFPADDCLANQRRDFRRQRRHIRSTRQRIARMKALLLSMGVMTADELDRNYTAAPWKLAAEALNGKTLSWIELWSVLRWYAHNRGYDGNRLASAKNYREEDAEDSKKSMAAKEMMVKFGTSSMCETMCHYLRIEPSGKVFASRECFKGTGVSFPRSVVVNEVERILNSHKGKLQGIDEGFIKLLTADPLVSKNWLKKEDDLPFYVQNRFWGGILFGQLAPRFDNRIIGKCPVSGEKLPLKSSAEFLEFRWAMLLANIRVGENHRPLTKEEIAAMNAKAAVVGGFGKRDFKKAVLEATGEKKHNLDALLTAPDADKSTVRYPGLFALTKNELKREMDECERRRLANWLFRGKAIEAGELCEKELRAELPSGRAPFSRKVMMDAVAAIYEGHDPREEGGLLYRDATKEDPLAERDIDQETNNHLIRHRIKILLRLMKDIVKDYAENNPARVGQVTIEMARDMKDLSGKTNKEIVSDMNDRTRQHKKAAQMLAKHLGIDERLVSPGLIRKVRIAEDMGWRCPYTGQKYDIQDIVSKSDGEAGNVDKDHILPRSQRATDSLSSLVLTFTEVNRLKGARTGLEFIREFGGQRVPGRENLVILDEKKYKAEVEKLKVFGHDDDRKRQKARKANLIRQTSDEAGMTEGMLTRTSHITKLASRAIRGFFANCGRTPEIVSIPGRVTAFLRNERNWNILGILSEVDPRIRDEHGLKLKQEIRGITHMHHAVDAIALGLAATYLRGNRTIQIGDIWALMCKRRVKEEEKAQLNSVGVFCFTAQNEPRLLGMPDWLRQQIKNALAEQRVVVHQPKEKGGLKADLTTWGIVNVGVEKVKLRQRTRNVDGLRELKYKEVLKSAAFGLEPKADDGKLKRINGVLIQDQNYGVALMENPIIIRHRFVWKQMDELKSRNGGVMPKVIRRLSLVRVDDKGGKHDGVWKIASVKDASAGIMLDLVRPYAIRIENKVDYAWINAGLKSLMKKGLEVVETKYTGVPLCPITSSTSQPRGQVSR